MVEEPQVTPLPLDQLLNVTPVGGVVYVAVGVAGQVTVAPPPMVTIVCPQLLPPNTPVSKVIAKMKLAI